MDISLCKICNKVIAFQKELSKRGCKKTKYCSYICSIKSNKYKKFTSVIRFCKVCNQSFTATRKNKMICSKICVKNYRDTFKIKQNIYKKRFDVLNRDQFTCKYCGASPKKNINVKLHIDHIFPKSKGGNDEMNNLITSCVYCNLGKLNNFYPNIFINDFTN